MVQIIDDVPSFFQQSVNGSNRSRRGRQAMQSITESMKYPEISTVCVSTKIQASGLNANMHYFLQYLLITKSFPRKFYFSNVKCVYIILVTYIFWYHFAEIIFKIEVKYTLILRFNFAHTIYHRNYTTLNISCKIFTSFNYFARL